MMAELELNWTSLAFGAPLKLTAMDGMDYTLGSDRASRLTRFSAGLDFSAGLGSERTRLNVSPSFGAVAVAVNDGSERSAYAWPYRGVSVYAGLATSLSLNRRRPAWRVFGSGLALQAGASLAYPAWRPRVDLMAWGGAEFGLPLRFTSYASWDPGGMDLSGASSVFGASPYSHAACGEYGGLGLSWLAGAEIEALVLSIEAQTNLSHLYFNRFFAGLSYRAAVYDQAGFVVSATQSINSPGFVHSAAFKLGAVLSATPAAAVPVSFAPYAWAALKLSSLTNTITLDDIAYGFGLDYRW